nr:TrmH family RNA methyltransferase [Pectobacterium colocasium]
MFHIALYEPQIAPNTGNIIRLAANNGCTLHLIEPLGFDFEEKKLRRAGLDYHDWQTSAVIKTIRIFWPRFRVNAFSPVPPKAAVLMISRATSQVMSCCFGSETSGLPDEIRNGFEPDFRIRIPMQSNNRSLNLSNAVAIISYEAWRQNGFGGCL